MFFTPCHRYGKEEGSRDSRSYILPESMFLISITHNHSEISARGRGMISTKLMLQAFSLEMVLLKTWEAL